MQNNVKELVAYLNKAHSVYHATAGFVSRLAEAGYTRLDEHQHWHLTPGGKYYLTRGSTSVLAFRIPENTPAGFMMTASHSDRPTFKVKENGELKGTYTRLAVERYGGMLISTWLDRPLSVAGRVVVATDNGVESRLVDIDRDLLMIPNVAIHMNRKANDGYTWNPAVDTLPLMGGKDSAGALESLLQKAAGGKILGHDLTLYVRQKAAVWGLKKEFLSAAALDDLACAWCCWKGFVSAEDAANVPVLCVFDSEEVGSASVQGAASDLLETVLSRICCAMGWNLAQMLAQSFMVSADNAHAVHPNHPEFADPTNAPVMNQGVVLKFNAAQRYTTDGFSGAIFRGICQKADVPVQTYYNRADLPGGSTLGNISLAHISVPTADIGLPQLAMHSSYETLGVQDVDHLVNAITQFYSTCLQAEKDGACRL